jgi:hypothetical protein
MPSRRIDKGENAETGGAVASCLEEVGNRQSRKSLAEMEVVGSPTTLPPHLVG